MEGYAQPKEEMTATPAPLTVVTLGEEHEIENLHSSPESPSRSSRDLRSVARAFTARYYGDMNIAPSLVRRYYTVRAHKTPFSLLSSLHASDNYCDRR